MNISNQENELPYETRIKLLIKHNKDLIAKNEKLIADLNKNKIVQDVLIAENSRLNIENTLHKAPKKEKFNFKRDQLILELRTCIKNLRLKHKSLQKDHNELIIKYLKVTLNDPTRTN